MQRLALAATAAVTLIVAVAFQSSTAKADHTREEPARALRILFTGDTRGYLEPCGCTKGLFGGLPKRATALQELRGEHDLLVDLGNIVEGTRPHDRVRLNYVLEGLKKLRYDVLVPGEGELAFGEEFERVAKELTRPRVVCANLIRSDSKAPAYQPWYVHKLEDGRRVAVIGVTSEHQRLPSSYKATGVRDAVARHVKKLRGNAEAIIVAGHIEGKIALDLARTFPDITVVLGSRVPTGSKTLLRRGGAPVMVGGERGQYLSAVDLGRDLAARSATQHWLPETVADDDELAKLVASYEADVSLFADRVARETLATFRSEGRVGSKACAECHQKEYDVWKRSTHAHAMETLKREKKDRNPDCFKCHLQDSATRRELVAGVGCESCHGPGRHHIALLKKHKGRIGFRTFATSARARCVKCHDAHNSPRFQHTQYWKKIAHGPASPIQEDSK